MVLQYLIKRVLIKSFILSIQIFETLNGITRVFDRNYSLIVFTNNLIKSMRKEQIILFSRNFFSENLLLIMCFSSELI